MEIKQKNQFYYRVQINDTIHEICKKFNTCKDNILRNNPALDLYVGEWILIKENEYITHIVKPAETISDIAKKYKTTEEKLTLDNNLKSNKLFIGQILKILHECNQ